MSEHKVTYYQVKCDCCGDIETDYGDYSAWADFHHAQSSAEGWEVIGDEDFCPLCWAWPEDMPNPDAYDNDDPVRKHTQHKEADSE